MTIRSYDYVSWGCPCHNKNHFNRRNNNIIIYNLNLKFKYNIIINIKNFNLTNY